MTPIKHPLGHGESLAKPKPERTSLQHRNDAKIILFIMMASPLILFLAMGVYWWPDKRENEFGLIFICLIGFCSMELLVWLLVAKEHYEETILRTRWLVKEELDKSSKKL